MAPQPTRKPMWIVSPMPICPWTVGGEMMLGQEETFGEPGTPEKAQFYLNATSLAHRGTRP